jgi:hypothetical protein
MLLLWCHSNSEIHLSIFNSTGATRSTCSVRTAKKRCTACPANNANMFWESQIDSASMDEQRNEQMR